MENVVSIGGGPAGYAAIGRIEVEKMLVWILGLAINESESSETRKNASVAGLFLAELFELGAYTTDRLNQVLAALKAAEDPKQSRKVQSRRRA